MRLTDIAIRQMPHTEKGQKRIRDEALPGFGITIGTRSKTFFVMYGIGRRLKTLGHWPEISLKEARNEARRVLAQSDLKKPVMSQNEAQRAFLEECYARLRPSTANRYAYALKKRPENATEIKCWKSFFNWCVRRGIMDHNPLQHERVSFAERERVLTDNEIATLWHYDHPPYSDIVKLLILTGQRRNQIWKLQPEWIGEDTITFPAAIMKSKRPHTIPLTGYRQHLPDAPYSFNGWSKAKLRMDRETGVNDYVLHDFRRYFSTTMAQIGVPLHITEHILDHRSQITGVAAVYNRYHFLPEMREAMLKYEEHIRSIVAA